MRQPVILSSGMSTLEEVRQAVKILCDGGLTKDRPEHWRDTCAGSFYSEIVCCKQFAFGYMACGHYAAACHRYVGCPHTRRAYCSILKGLWLAINVIHAGR